MDDLLSNISTRKNKVSRILVDGCFDLLHYGHINLLRQARDTGFIVVSSVSSSFSASMEKKSLIQTDSERSQLLRHIKYVDQVISKVPYTITLHDLEKTRTDSTIHGSDITVNNSGSSIFQPFIEAGKHIELPRTEGISSTQKIIRITQNVKDLFEKKQYSYNLNKIVFKNVSSFSKELNPIDLTTDKSNQLIDTKDKNIQSRKITRSRSVESLKNINSFPFRNQSHHGCFNSKKSSKKTNNLSLIQYVTSYKKHIRSDTNKNYLIKNKNYLSDTQLAQIFLLSSYRLLQSQTLAPLVDYEKSLETKKEKKIIHNAKKKYELDGLINRINNELINQCLFELPVQKGLNTEFKSKLEFIPKLLIITKPFLIVVGAFKCIHVNHARVLRNLACQWMSPIIIILLKTHQTIDYIYENLEILNSFSSVTDVRIGTPNNILDSVKNLNILKVIDIGSKITWKEAMNNNLLYKYMPFSSGIVQDWLIQYRVYKSQNQQRL